MNKTLLLALTFHFVLFGQFPNTRNAESGNPFITYFSPKDYDGERINWSIIQDSKGIVYVGNQNGILEFDGNNWRKINVPNNEAVRAMDIDENRTIYLTAGSDFGYLETDSLGRLNYRSLIPFLDNKYKNLGEFWDVATSSRGIYFKTRDKILRWYDNKFTVWDSVFAFRLYNIDDKIYSRNDGLGLMVIDGDSIKLMPDGEFFESIGVYNMLPYKEKSKDGIRKILITTSQDGLFLFDGKKFAPFKTDAEALLKSHQIYNACVMSNGDYAFSTQRGGVVIMNQAGKLLGIINKNSSLPTDVVFDVYPEKNGGLWFATVNGIAFCEVPSAFSIYNDMGLQEEMTYSVLRFNETIYTTNELGVFYLSEGQSNFRIVTGSTKPAYKLLNLDGMLLAQTNGGVALIENGKYTKVLPTDGGTALIKSKAFPRRIYVGSDRGISILEKDSKKEISIKFDKYLIDGVTSIAEEKDGSLWLKGYFNGLYHVTGKLDELTNGNEVNVDFKFYDSKDNNVLPAKFYDVLQIQNKVIFTTDKGLFKYDKESQNFLKDSTFGNYFSDSSNTITLIKENQNGDLWILADSNGQMDLGKAILQKDGSYKWKPNKDFRRIDLNAVLEIYPEFSESSQSEILWFGSNDGLIKYDPNLLNVSDLNYSTIIRKILVNNDSLIYAGKNLSDQTQERFIFPYTNNDITFEFSAATYVKPEATLYQYFLEGNDKDWSQWTSETKKDYTNLSKGDYKFHIRSKNLYGIVSNGEVFAFEILAPWYLTYWAIAFYVLTIMLGMFLIDRFMRRKIIRKEREKSRLREAEFRAEAAELQAKAAESQSKIIQAENERKSNELEEARQLQLSMLPKTLPKLANIDIAVYMKTATEVGGDYYDFIVDENGTLTFAIGDATGHGMKAGIIVSMVKALFSSGESKLDIKTFFNQSSDTLKGIELGRLMMGFLMLKIKSNKVEFGNAGMPPLFIYRKDSNTVEEIILNGMPLGAMKNFPYETKELEISSGDTILLLSDGLPELKNEKNEQYDYEQVKNEFNSVAGKSPNEIVKYLVTSASKWSNGIEPDDDVTFVVIKVK